MEATYTSLFTMPVFDPELAALMPPAPAAGNGGPQHLPTIAELRAQFDQYVTAPFKAYQEPLLPPGECLIRWRLY